MKRLLAFGTWLLLAGACDDEDPTPEQRADAGTESEALPSSTDAAIKPGTLLDARAGDSAQPADASFQGAEATSGDAALADAGLTPTQPPTWQTCETRFECATLEVPLDYDHPEAGTVRLALKRSVTKDHGRKGSLLFNLGGPGAASVASLADVVSIMTPALRAEFDIVAFDPRGVGDSEGLDCHSTLQALYAADPSPDDEDEWQALVAADKTFADECAQKHARLLPHLTTPNVARDMDRVRAAVADEKLTYIGFSYGTVLGAWYAELFPERVRALALDGAVDLKLPAIELALQQSQGFELAFEHYFDWCRAQPTRCKWTEGADPSSAFRALSARIDASPLPSKDADRPAGPGELNTGAGEPLYEGEAGWPSLSAALDSAQAGDGSRLISLTDDYLARESDGSYPDEEEAYNAFLCNDRATPSLDELRAAEPRFAAATPIQGAVGLAGLVMCSQWPVQGRDLPPPTGKGAAPILVVGTTGDPATPLSWAEGLADELESGVLLRYDGEGHTAFRTGSSCVDAAVESYLLFTTLPTADCPRLLSLRTGSPSSLPTAVRRRVR